MHFDQNCDGHISILEVLLALHRQRKKSFRARVDTELYARLSTTL
jgi:hypothetical protein